MGKTRSLVAETLRKPRSMAKLAWPSLDELSRYASQVKAAPPFQVVTSSNQMVKILLMIPYQSKQPPKSVCPFVHGIIGNLRLGAKRSKTIRAAPRASHTQYNMQGCAVHRGIKHVCRTLSWCRITRSTVSSLLPFSIPSK